MDKKYESLFTPWKIGNVEIKNRIVLTSMGGTSLFGWMEPHHFDKEAANFILERAKNNVGLILPGIAPIRNVMGGAWLYKSKKSFKALKEFMTEFHKTGAKLFIQLTAGFGRSFAVNELMEKMEDNKLLGALGKPLFDVDRLTASCSELPNRWSDKIPSRALTVKEIEDMIYGFAETARMCKEAGVDGVEIHAVHEGYLLDQFTLKYCNKRKDEYGGSFEGRYKFAVDIVKAIKKVCGDDYPVSLRYSVVSKTKDFRLGAMPGEDFVEIGRDMEESKAAAKYLQDAGYDMLNADNGTYDAWYWSHPPMYMPENCNLADVSEVKKAIDIPIVCAGRMSPEVAAKAIEAGELDAMGVARQFLVDPEWVTKIMEDRAQDIMPCICCHNGCFNMSKYSNSPNVQDLDDTMHMARCALNPVTMHTDKYKIVKAKKPRNIGIIGGGIGGMEVARVASMRGHKVTIYEKSDRLGGIFNEASSFDFKEKDKELIEWYKREMTRLGIEIKFNTNITDIESIKADKVVVATGAMPRHIPIKGVEKTVEACEYLDGNYNKDADKIIIVGGGLTGSEIAYDLSLKGKHPIIVEMLDDIIAVKGVSLANTSYLRDYFKLHKTPIYLETKVKEITDTGVIAVDKAGKEFNIDGDAVIMSVGYVPNPLTDKAILVGDCKKVGNLRTVIWGAWDVAMKL